MLLSFLLALLVVATLALFSIGAILAHQQRMDVGQRRSNHKTRSYSGGATVTLGELVTEMSQSDRDEHALAKLRLEAQAQKRMADIIG